MFTLMLADDEELSRYALKTLISKNFDNVTVVAEAQSGTEAVELYRKHRPDGVIMDIRIPGKNGLVASKEILYEFPDASIIICSAYDHFSYVSQALDLGIKGYMLKPIRQDEAVEKIMRLFGVKNSPLQSLAESQALCLMVSGLMGEDMRVSLNRYYGSIESGVLCCFEVQNGEPEKLLEEISYYFKKHVPKMCSCLAGVVGKRIAGYIFPKSDACLIYRCIDDLLGEQKDVLNGRYLAVDHGEWAQTWGELCAHANAVSSSALEKGECVETLLSKLRSGDRTGFEEALNLWLNQFQKQDFQTALEHSVKLLSLMQHQLEKLDLRTGQMGLLQFIGENASGDKALLETQLKNAAEVMLLTVEHEHKSQTSVLNEIYNLITDESLAYISLESLADEMGISPQYLSRSFKDKTGMNFIEYVTLKRMEKAYRLIRMQNVSVREIAQSCGYNDIAYFNRMFKKTFGVTPVDCRRKTDEQKV